MTIQSSLSVTKPAKDGSPTEPKTLVGAYIRAVKHS